jgi:tetratricopeptide (TPR) repeat protein
VNTFSVLSIPYASDTQRIELAYLRVRKPDGSVVETPAADAQDQPAPVAEQAPFYSDLHLFQLPVRGLSVGDRVEYQVLTVQKKAETPNEFWGQESFGRDVVVLERSLELRVPASSYVQVSSPAYPAQVTTEGAERVYRWQGAQRKLSPKPNADGSVGDSSEDAQPAPIAWTTFHSWAEVGEWYRKLSMDRTVVTPALKARADELTAGATTEHAKMEAIYNFVSSRVRYVGVSFGIGRYQPHAAAQVLANQYGDCKDKHTLLSTLLKAEGINTSSVLIGAGIPFDKAVPMPADFNHLITLTRISPNQSEGQKDIWLDSTEEVAPPGMLDASLRDKMALVIPAVGTPELRRTPADPPFAQVTRFEADGTLSAKGEMTAQVDVHLRGDGELAMRGLLRSVTPGQWDRVSELYANMLGFGGQTSNTTADAPDKTATPLHLHYTYTRDPYGDWSDFRIIPLIGGVNLPLTDARTAPAKEIDFGGRRTDTSVSRIMLPEGYRADLPAAVHLHTDFANFDKTYRLETEKTGAVLVTERTLVVSVDKLPASRWAEYKRFVDNTVGVGEPWVQLTSMNSLASGKRPPAPGEDNPVAAELVRQAEQLFAMRDWSTAQSKLDEARSVNPRQAYLWSELGYVAQAGGKVGEAVEDYKHELAQHPDEDNVSHLLASTQRMQNESDAAVATLKADLQHNAKDEQGVLMLADLLSSHAAYGEAEKALRTTLTAVPDSLQVKLTLGSTLVREGKTAEGEAILRELATTSEDPGVLNDAAFALADTSQDLPLAEKAARHSLALLDAATVANATGTADPTELRRATLLVATWDTMGWVLYKEDRPAQAVPWLRAAWFHGSGRDTGYHLAMALAAQGEKNDALRTLELADGNEPLNATDVQSHDLCVEEEAALRKDGAAGTAGDAHGAIGGEQSFHLAQRNTKLEGSAMFQLRVAADGVRTVDLTEGNPALGPMADALKQWKLEQYVPKDSRGVVLRLGVLSCNEESGCDFVLTPMDNAAAL